MNKSNWQIHTKNLGPWTVSTQRPAPGGNVRSADADTETISSTAIRVGFLPLSVDCDGGWPEASAYNLQENHKIQKGKVTKKADKETSNSNFTLE